MSKHHRVETDPAKEPCSWAFQGPLSFPWLLEDVLECVVEQAKSLGQKSVRGEKHRSCQARKEGWAHTDGGMTWANSAGPLSVGLVQALNLQVEKYVMQKILKLSAYLRKVNETFPDISNNRGCGSSTSAVHTKRLYLQKQPLAQVLFIGPIGEDH